MDGNNSIVKVDMFFDESGHMHKNSHSNYFVIGGYFVLSNNVLIKKKYFRQLLKIKKKRHMGKTQELKGRMMDENEKIKLLNSVLHLDDFNCVSILLENKEMNKPITNETLFYNYLMKIMIDRIIKQSLRNYEKNSKLLIQLHLDNRNTGLEHLKSLEDYLNTQFIMTRYSFTVEYCDSAMNYCVQIADLIAHVVYMHFKDANYDSKAFNTLQTNEHYYITFFPKNLTLGKLRRYK